MRKPLAILLIVAGGGSCVALLLQAGESRDANVVLYGESATADAASSAAHPIRPRVSRFLKVYRQPRMTRPAERLLHPLAKIHDIFKKFVGDSGGDAGVVVSRTVFAGVREQLHIFEAGLKVYKKAHRELRPLYAELKALEDLYGRARDASGFALAARRHGAPAAVQKVLDRSTMTAEAELSRVLWSRWAPKKNGQIPGVLDAVTVIASVPFAVGKKDTAYVRKRLARQLKKSKKVEYDLTKLEGDFGIHEFRRNLRRIRNTAIALDGLVRLEPRGGSSEPERFANADKHLVAEDLRLPKADAEQDRIVLSRSLYAAARVATSELADVKEPLEILEAIAGAYREAGIAVGTDASRRETLKLLGLSASEPDRLVAEAQRILARCVETKLFASLRRDVKMKRQREKPLPPWGFRPRSAAPVERELEDSAPVERELEDSAPVERELEDSAPVEHENPVPGENR